MTAIVTVPNIYYNVKKFQAVCDGVTDDTTFITNAITAASSAGGGYVFLPGLCAISSPLTLPSGVRLIGAGLNTGLKALAGFSGAQMVLCNAYATGVLNMQIGETSTTYSSNPATNGIQVTGAVGVLIRDVFLQYINGWGVQSTATAGQANYNLICDNVHVYSSAKGFKSLGVTGSNYNGVQHFVHCNVDLCQNGDCYHFEDVEDILCTNILGSCTAGSGSSLDIKGACASIYIENVDLGPYPGPSTGSVVVIESGANGSPSEIAIRGGIIEGGTSGVAISAGTLIQVTDCQIFNNGTYGINITGGDAILIDGCTFSGNGSAGSSGRYDFQSSTANHVEVSDCYFYTAQGTTAGKTNNAVNVTAGNVAMRGCSFYGTGYSATNIFNNFPSSIINCPGYGSVPVLPFALYDGDLGSNSTGVGVANTAYLVGVELRAPILLTGVRVRFANTGGTGHYDTGIYDATGTNGAPNNLLAHAASTNTSLVMTNGVQTPALIAGSRALVGGNLPLEPGNYWLALWVDNASDQINRVTSAANLGVVMSGTNAGPLPAAAASLTGLGNGTLKPIIIGIRSGGWS